MTLNFNEIEELVSLRAAYDAAMEADCVATETWLDAEGTPQEEAASAVADATTAALNKAREALQEAELREMVSAIKGELGAASVRFTVERHSFTLFPETPYPYIIPGMIFRFPGHESLFLEAREIVDEEDEEERYSFGWGVEIHDEDNTTWWFIDKDLNELIAEVVGRLTERRANKCS